MATSKVCRTVNAYDIWATLITSGLVMAVLFYFVADTTVRFLHKEKVELWTLVAMAISFLIVAQIACIYWLNIRNNIPNELLLLEQYLEQGKIVVGDVHYPADKAPSCCCADPNMGTIIYRHPVAQYKGCFVAKYVPLVDKFERELETMLILPGEPYSAQPRHDVQGLLAIGKKRYEITSLLGVYSLLVLIVSLLAAGYVIFVTYSLDTDEGQLSGIRYLGWIMYGTACILIPCISILACGIKWKRHMEWMKKGNHRFVQDDDDDYTTLTHLPEGVRDTDSAHVI